MVQPLRERWWGCAGPAGRVLCGGAPAQGGVGPVAVVLGAPGIDNNLGHGQGGELPDVEQLVADPPVERLDERVLPRGAGFDELGAGAGESAVVPQRPGDHLGAVVHPQLLGSAAGSDQTGQLGDDVVGGAMAGDPHGQRLPGVLVDDVEQLEPSPVGGLVELRSPGPTPGWPARPATGRWCPGGPGGACGCGPAGVALPPATTAAPACG